MVQILFVRADGTQQSVEGVVGESLMQVATGNGIDEILAECGGCCSCATCHCIVDEEWAKRLPSPDDMEQDMLEGVIERQPTSRLSCQINVGEELDGIVVHLPETQT